ncbi:MAG TPA: hypothetical protein PLZ57_00835 [Pseudobdellovibrionaceae bacterium]|mgnify:CR=1 FL=1|nr:hypothetical protein [Pseudobdellovibrionaceae bacterium]
MNRFVLAIILTLQIGVCASALAHSPAYQPIKLEFDVGSLPLKFRVFEAPIALGTRLFEVGHVKKTEELTSMRELTGQTIQMDTSSGQMLILFVENKSDRPVKFAASPHGFKPEENSLGLSFKCLCFGHLFTAEPGKLWYRIVRLLPVAALSGELTTIQHKIVSPSQATKARSSSPQMK